MRLTFGLVFVPSFRWFVNQGVDLSVVLILSTLPMMPFRSEAGEKSFSGAPPSGSRDWWLFLYAWGACIGALVQDLGKLHNTLFQGIDVMALWLEFLKTAVGEPTSVWRDGVEDTHDWLSPQSPPREGMAAKVHSLRKLAHRVGRLLRRMRKLCIHALVVTVQRAVDPFRWQSYMNEHFLDLAARTLSLVSLSLAITYTRARDLQHQMPQSDGLLSIKEESVLAFTVVLLWIRQLKVLQVFRLTGWFVYMLFQMFHEVFLWLTFYFITVIGFSAGLRVLYRNQLMESGYLYRSRDESTISDLAECEHLEISLRELMTTILLMLEITFDGASYWQCYYNSHSPVAGVLIHVSFMMFVLVVLMNVLIAMMANTYNKVHEHSFSNYVFGFSKLIIEWGDRYPALWNLCLLPSTTARLMLPTECQSARLEWSGRFPVPRLTWHSEISDQPHLRTQHGEKLRLDLDLVKRLHKIRMEIIQSPSKMVHFRKAIGRYCRVQDDDTIEEWLDPLAEKVHDIVEDELELVRRAREETLRQKRSYAAAQTRDVVQSVAANMRAKMAAAVQDDMRTISTLFVGVGRDVPKGLSKGC